VTALQQGDLKRRLLLAGVVIGAFVSFMAAMTAVTSGTYQHDRRAMRAFFTWRETPTAENERVWLAARDAAMVRDMKFKGLCIGVAFLSGLVAWRCHRASRSLGSSVTGVSDSARVS
jgi:hypothetical protein